MGQDCCKCNRKGKEFDSRILQDASDQSERGSYGGKIEYKERGGNNYKEQKDSAANQRETTHDQLRNDQDQKTKTYEEELKRKTEKIKQLEAEISDLSKRTGKQNSKIRTHEEELKRSTEKIKQLEAEKNDLLTRLSSEAAIKMTYNNPNITNLSDQDRPTKVSERYAELYDNQWTDAFEILLTKHNMSDTKAIEVLLDILYVSFEKCKEVRKQRENLENCITEYVGVAAGDLTVLEVMTTLKDASKKNLAKILKEYTKTVQEALQEKYDKELQNVSHYLDECVEICLLMNLHNPALELRGCMVDLNQPFDVTYFRSYTKSGDRISYVVWPALYLYKDGPLLCRGVAQGTSDSSKIHKDHAVKETHQSKGSDSHEHSKLELKMDRDQASNNDITKETIRSFAEEKEVQVSMNSRDTGKNIELRQSQQNNDTKRQTNFNFSSDILTRHDKSTNQEKDEPKGKHITNLHITKS